MTDLAERMLERITQQLATLRAEQEETREYIAILASRVSDLSHMSIDEVALRRKVSRATVRAQIRAGHLTLERIPGTKISGIPIDQVFSGWLPLATSRAAAAKEKSHRVNGGQKEGR